MLVSLKERRPRYTTVGERNLKEVRKSSTDLQGTCPVIASPRQVCDGKGGLYRAPKGLEGRRLTIQTKL